MVDPNRKEAPRCCVFCGANKLSNEHVWPRWIARLVEQRLGPSMWQVQYGGSSRAAGTLDAKVKRVCATCNNGWMSQIEGLAQPILTEMMLGRQTPLPLSVDNQRILANWAMKTALMADFLQTPRAMDAHWYSRLFSTKAPPDRGAMIWIAAYEGTELRFASTTRRVDVFTTHRYSPHGVLIPGRETITNGGAVCTLRVLCFVAQIFLWDRLPAPGPDEENRRPIQRIWPAPRTTVEWPPNRTFLTDKGIEGLIARDGLFRGATRVIH